MNDNRKHARRIRHEATMLQGTTGAPLNNEQYELWLAYAVKHHAGDWMETWRKFCAENPGISPGSAGEKQRGEAPDPRATS